VPSHDLYRKQIARLFEKSEFYRRKLCNAGFDSPAAVGGLERIAELPFTEKDELRRSQAAHPPLGTHAAVEIAQVARIYSTSGTSGAPLYIPLTRNDVEDWRAIGRDTYSKNGLKAGERVVTTFGAGPFVAGASLTAFEAIGCAHIPVGVGNTDKLLAALKQLEPQCLAATPSYAMHIAEKLSGAKTSIERIIVGGEPGGGEESFRKKLQDAFDARVYEIMGIGDIAASLWGECGAQAGMHFSGEGVIHVELIDPDSGRNLELRDGAQGELVYTHLKREAAPLLRFRSRDHVQLWVSKCSCKRSSLRVRCIGRTDDMLIVRGVNVFSLRRARGGGALPPQGYRRDPDPAEAPRREAGPAASRFRRRRGRRRASRNAGKGAARRADVHAGHPAGAAAVAAALGLQI
jgi:phenylacetate-CoA ligase